MSSRPIMLVDSLNFYLRYYASNPQMDKNGELCGGVVGFMKGLAALTKRLMPEKVFLIWEGGGSPRRLKILPEYKEKRKPIKTNRIYGDFIPDTEENKNYQMHVIVALAKSLPLYQIYVENCEADDVIGYLCNKTFKDRDKIIVSSDKDFYQLLNDKTKIYRPGKKVFVSEKDVREEYKIDPKNFCVAKALNGDNSDNINGVPRVGFKVLAKRFDFLNRKVEIENIINESKEQIENTKKPLKIYKNIIDNEKIIYRNYELMRLDDKILSIDQINDINRIVREYKPLWNKIKFWRKYLEFELDGMDPDHICNAFQFLIYSITK